MTPRQSRAPSYYVGWTIIAVCLFYLVFTAAVAHAQTPRDTAHAVAQRKGIDSARVALDSLRRWCRVLSYTSPRYLRRACPIALASPDMRAILREDSLLLGTAPPQPPAVTLTMTATRDTIYQRPQPHYSEIMIRARNSAGTIIADSVPITLSDPAALASPPLWVGAGNSTCPRCWHLKDAVKSTTLTVTATYQGVTASKQLVLIGPAPPPDTTTPPVPPDTTTPPPSGSVTAPTLPQDSVDVRPLAWTRFVPVPSGGLQAAIDAAQCGDFLALSVTGSYVGPFRLRPRTCYAGIGLQNCPAPPDTRIRVSHSPQLPKVTTADLSLGVFVTDPSAAYYRLQCFEVAPGTTTAQSYNTLVRLLVQNPTTTTRPHHIVLDRLYIHAEPTHNVQRCVFLNVAAGAVINSWLSECHYKGADAQAIESNDTPGPLLIENNHLEASGENVMFGGVFPTFATPADITIRRNYFVKPLRWKGQGWTIKNLFELKYAARVLVEGNVLQNNWHGEGQDGFAVLMKTSGEANQLEPYTRDVTIRYNTFSCVGGGFALAGVQSGTVPLSRVAIYHNIVDSINVGPCTGNSWSFLAGSGELAKSIADLVIDRNTFTTTTVAAAIMFASQPAVARFQLRQNVLPLGTYGVFLSGAGQGTAAFTKAVTGGQDVTGNLFVGSTNGWAYPAGNTIVATFPANLPPGIGADTALVRAKTAGVVVVP